METRVIFFKGTDLEVSGNYYRGFLGSYEDPPEPPELEIVEITIGGVDVTELLEDYLEEIKIKILENW